MNQEHTLRTTKGSDRHTPESRERATGRIILLLFIPHLSICLVHTREVVSPKRGVLRGVESFIKTFVKISTRTAMSLGSVLYILLMAIWHRCVHVHIFDKVSAQNSLRTYSKIYRPVTTWGSPD